MSAKPSTADRTENNTVTETLEVELPTDVVDAIADQLEDVDDPDASDARDFAHEHVATSFRFVTSDGREVEQVALERAT